MVVGKGCDFERVAITVGVGPWLHVSGGYEVAGLGRTRGSSDAGEVYEVPLVGGLGGCGGVGVGVFFGSFSQETNAKRRDIDRTPKNLGCSLMIVCIGVNKKVT